MNILSFHQNQDSFLPQHIHQNPQYQRHNIFPAETFQYFPGLKALGASYLLKTHEKVTLHTIQC